MNNVEDVSTASAAFLDKYKSDHGYNSEWQMLELESLPLDQTLESIRPVPVRDDTTVKADHKSSFISSITGHYNASWLSQFSTLYWRSFLNITRNPGMLFA